MYLYQSLSLVYNVPQESLKLDNISKLYLSLVDQINTREKVGDTRNKIWCAHIISASKLNTVLYLNEECGTHHHWEVQDIAYQYCKKVT